MSARTRRPGWLGDLVGQVATFGAVPAAIVLALALRPGAGTETGTDTGEVRTIPLWHNAGHSESCPTCRLAKRQASKELDVEQTPASAPEEASAPVVDLSHLWASDSPQRDAETAESAASKPDLASKPPRVPVPAATTTTRPILAIEPVTVL